MKLAVYQVPGVSLGKHNVKDPRLDAADKLVEAKKKIYVQADIVGEDEMKEADAILVPAELKGDLVLLDMEFLELRLGREQSPEEKALFEKLYAHDLQNQITLAGVQAHFLQPFKSLNIICGGIYLHFTAHTVGRGDHAYLKSIFHFQHPFCQNFEKKDRFFQSGPSHSLILHNLNVNPGIVFEGRSFYHGADCFGDPALFPNHFTHIGGSYVKLNNNVSSVNLFRNNNFLRMIDKSFSYYFH